MSKYPLTETRLAIATRLVKEVLEKIPGVPWIVVAHNAIAHFNDNKEQIKKDEFQFFDRYSDSFLTTSYIFNHKSEIRECMPIDYNLFVVNAIGNGRIVGVKLSTDKDEILNTFQSHKSIIDGIMDSYNDKAEEARERFDLKNEIKLLTTIAQLSEGDE